MKFCKDCKHFEPMANYGGFLPPIPSKCSHPDALDLINGEPQPVYLVRNEICTKYGNYWEAK